MTNPVLTTPRLTLRCVVAADAAFFVELLNEPSFIENIGDRGVRTTADAERYLAEKYLASYERHGYGLYVVELKDGGVPIGICGLVKRDALEHPDIGFALLPRYWSNGYAAEAAAETVRLARGPLMLPYLYGVVSPQNTRSIRLLERLGLRRLRSVQLPGNAKPSDIFGMELGAP